MAKGFDLASVFQDMPVPESGTNEQVKKIPMDLIDSDERNFYELSGIDELASNILTVGLMDPIRIRPTEGGRYTIVSGHRRRAAMQQLLEDGHEEFAEIPCIVDAGDMSPELQELRLIFANSDTRKLTNGDLLQQTERVQTLLYQLKEQGFEFPGRMRDYVAEACKVSKTKISNLKVIKEKLSSMWMDAYKQGGLSEEAALQLTKSPKAIQQLIAEQSLAVRKTLASTPAWRIEYIQRFMDRIDAIKCPQRSEPASPCTHSEQMLKHYCMIEFKPGYLQNCTGRCCTDCDQLPTCKDACPLLAKKAKRLKAERAEKKKEQKIFEEEQRQRLAEADDNMEKFCAAMWRRIPEALKFAGVSVKDYLDKLGWGRGAYPAFEHLATGTEITPRTAPPIMDRWETPGKLLRICEIADYLGVSIDYLCCRTDVPQLASGTAAQDQEPTPSGLRWHPGPDLPDHPCMLVCKFQLEDGDLKAALCHYDGNALYVCWQDTHFGGDYVDIDPDLDSMTKSEPVCWVELEGEKR